MSRRFCLVIAASLGMAGCNRANSQDTQYDDSRNTHYKQAQQDLDNNNPAAAAQDYESALAANPKLVEAQYQLGILYGEKLQDPISSIYHFRRFLDLAPNSDHAANAKAMIEKESQAFAASLPNSPTQNADDYAKLQADNAALKKQVDDATHTIAQLQTKLGRHHEGGVPANPSATPLTADNNSSSASTPPPASDSSSTAPSTNAPPSGPQRALPLDATNAMVNTVNPNATNSTADAGPSRTYTVIKGDSLWKIAHKMYPGDTKNGVDKIQEANKDAIGTKPLKIGQVLIIPQ
jgi:tetratricopeptide (TPR) repeat protein